MHAAQLLHKFFEKSAYKIHKRRLTALFSTIDSLIRGRLLTLSGLGQSMPGQAKVKHCIKKVDRLLGNAKLYDDRMALYQLLAHHVIGKVKQPIILIDWSQLDDNDKYYIIRAAVPFGGRSITIYEEAYPKKLYDTPPINKRFLIQLEQIIPAKCNPIIVTDAGTGFRTSWFQQIQSMKWDFVGRVRSGKKMLININNLWLTCKDLYRQAKKQAKYLGNGLLTQRSEFACKFYLAGKTIKKRSNKHKKRYAHEPNDRKYSRRAIEPWLLATSLDSDTFSPTTIISIYKQRMQIEEAFRDTKNQRIGFSLKKTLSRSTKRLDILLLIGTLASYIAFIIGKTAKALSLEHQFQATTVKHRAVISSFNLGCQIWLFRKVTIPIQHIRRTLKSMHSFLITVEHLS